MARESRSIARRRLVALGVDQEGELFRLSAMPRWSGGSAASAPGQRLA